MSIYLKLFWSFFQVGLFSVGGGYASVPLVQEQVVEKYHWLTMNSFSDIVTIAEMSPGPISINISAFVGIRISGLTGGIIATLGCITPSCIIVFLLSFLYMRFRQLNLIDSALKGMRCAVISLIATAGLSLFCMALYGQRKFPANYLSFRPLSIGVILIAFTLLHFKKVKAIYIMLLSGCLYVIVHHLVL